ncbi:AAA family ATPase [Candidatus Poribacteria bacterium]|nr:AAA family ATPase [Candidatus Poribacteria bacterium]
MLLERIFLKSFGCFKREDLELKDGINLIFGPNFSGKSTLVNAIFFTLTGKPIVPKVPLAAMTQSGALSGTAGIEFTDQGKSYQLFRSTHGEIQLRHQQNGGWQILFTGKRSADEELRKMFQLTYHHLSATAFLREGEIFEFLSRQPADRREILYALLGIDRLIEVRQRFIEGRRISKREETRIQQHQRSLRVTTLKSHREEIQRIEEELKQLEEEHERLSSRSPDSSDATLIAELTQSRSRLQQQIDTSTEERNSLLSGFTDASHIRKTIETIESAMTDAQGLEAQREEIIQKVGSLTSQIEVLTTACETLRQLIDTTQGHCPTCHQPVQREVIAQLIDEKEAEKTKYQEELAAQKKQLDQHTANVNALRELNQRRQLLSSKIERLERLEPQLAELQREFNTVNERLNALQPTDVPQTNIDDPAQSVERRRQLKFRIDNLRRRIVKLNSEEAVLSHKLEEVQRVREEANRILRTRLCSELACEGVEKTIQALQHQILQPVEEELQRWLKRMNLFEVSSVDLKSQHLLPSLKISGVDRSLMLLSGSEKIILYLCFKVALSKALGNPGFFVFDDPTLHLDLERKDLMVGFIHKLAEEYQVIVTSNDPDVREGLSGAHLIETKCEGGSQ